MKDLNIWFLEIIKKYNKNIAIIDGNKEASYNDVYIDASKVYKHISNGKVLIKCANKYNYSIAYMASIFKHAMPFLSNPESNVYDNYKFDNIIDDEFVNNCLKDNDYKLYEYEEFDNNMPCMVILSSGTTATPKPVVLSHKAVCLNLESVRRESKIPLEKNVISFLPLDHIFGMRLDLIDSFINADKLVYVYSLLDYFLKIRKYHPYKINIPTSILYNIKDLLEQEGLDRFDPDLERIVVGGAKCPKDLQIEFKEKYNIDIYNSYGMTECCPSIAFNSKEHNLAGSDGHILDCQHIRIGDNDEIIISGAIMLNYLEEYEKGIIVKEIHTKDIGYVKDGFLFVTGRIDNLIILDNGFKIQPEAFEEKIKEEFNLTDCILFYRNKELYLYIASNEKVKEEIENKYSNMYLNVKIVDLIKKSKLGKIDRKYYLNGEYAN